uniref:Uncharacterized protein n=1 Tax=Siphoviridae sp. ctfZQ2 TaxID=2826415 RepID=A0A8S5NC43_9CAUD|nr:MAG TPA: hypothetical protein [Siphoviridae sp. ctfZQ2]
MLIINSGVFAYFYLKSFPLIFVIFLNRIHLRIHFHTHTHLCPYS